mmetsp:Transcript_90829/g.261726  ORF Transcript_90829/g.261726 Transcript_90829/m.261726 type:complete len:692 (-) Transcript_90829:103-2178(-)
MLAADALRIGQAIEFKVGDETHLAMILGRVSEGEDLDGATHRIEVLSGKERREERVSLDQQFGLMTGGMVGAVPTKYRFKGFYLPPLPEHQEHHYTDRRFLCFFILALGMCCRIGVYAFRNGHIGNLHHAVDYQGRMCGVDVPGKRMALWCWRKDSDLINLRHPICVEHCPDSNETTHECWDHPSQGLVTRQDYPTRAFLHSPYCWPKDERLLEQIREARGNRVPCPGKLLIGMPRASFWVIPIAAGISSLVGYTYFRLLEKFVDRVVYIFINFVTYLFLVVGCYHLLLYWKSDGGSRHLITGCVLIAVSLSAFSFVFSETAQSSINRAAGCIEAACECITEEVSLLFEPLVAMLLRMAILVAFLVIFVLLVTCGAPRIVEGRKRHGWGYSAQEQFYIAYMVVMFFWLMEFTTSLSQYVLAWATQRWYFTPYVDDTKIDRPHKAVCKGYFNALRWHLGTLAYGSLLIGVLRIPRIVLKGIKVVVNLAAGRKNGSQVCGCLGQGLEHINKNAYIGVALTTESFRQAAVSADLMLNDNKDVRSIAWLNGMQGIFQLGGLILITAAAGFGTFVWVSLSNVSGPDIAVRDALIWIGIIVAFPIGLSYMTLFDTVGDTILYCWAVQERRYNYHKEHLRKRGGNRIRGMLSTVMSSFSADERGEELSKVKYAPPALRELLLGRQPRLANVSPGDLFW